MVIWFNCEKARNQLKFHGKVITCRVRRKQFGITNAIYRNDQGIKVIIGKVNVKKLEETIDTDSGVKEFRHHRDALKEHLGVSGFDSAKDWEDEILRLNSKGKIPSYLIFLEVTLKDVF